MTTTTAAAELAQQTGDRLHDEMQWAYEEAATARERMTAAGLAYLAHMIRWHLPTAAAITIRADDLAITDIRDTGHLLWTEHGPRQLPREWVFNLCTLLTDILTFCRDEEVMTDLGWEQERPGEPVYSIALPATL